MPIHWPQLQHQQAQLQPASVLWELQLQMP
jgi:hypothetical protein